MSIYTTENNESNKSLNEKIEDLAKKKEELKSLNIQIEQLKMKMIDEIKKHFNITDKIVAFHCLYRYKNKWTVSVSKYKNETKERFTFTIY